MNIRDILADIHALEEETLNREDFATLLSDDPGDTPSENDATKDSSSQDTPPQVAPPSTAPLPA